MKCASRSTGFGWKREIVPATANGMMCLNRVFLAQLFNSPTSRNPGRRICAKINVLRIGNRPLHELAFTLKHYSLLKQSQQNDQTTGQDRARINNKPIKKKKTIARNTTSTKLGHSTQIGCGCREMIVGAQLVVPP